MKRLETVFSLISPCRLFADIGTDHGQIAFYASKLADKVIATDISEKCLTKAKNNVSAKNVEFAAGDGLKALSGNNPDIIAICGMGGFNITDILKDYGGNAVLILQPQNDVPHVRRFLNQNDYTITHDLVAYEKGKYYDVLRANKEEQKPEILTDLMLLFGKFYQNKCQILKNRLLKLKQSYQSYKATLQNLDFLSKIDKALSFQTIT